MTKPAANTTFGERLSEIQKLAAERPDLLGAPGRDDDLTGLLEIVANGLEQRRTAFNRLVAGESSSEIFRTIGLTHVVAAKRAYDAREPIAS